MGQSTRKQVSRITFVILHYNTIEHTRACVSSLLNQKDADIDVVLVDNGSTNGTGRILAAEYGEVDSITVILHQRNVGYAQGINIGYRHAKHALGATCICLSNNDVVYEGDGFVREVCDTFNRENCDVLGPAIYVPEENIYQNPRWDHMLTVAEVDRLLQRYQRRKWRLKLGFKNSISPAIPFLFSRKRTSEALLRSIKPPSQWDAQLHGASVFVGPRFIAARDDAFNPATVFSCEMDILCLECAQAGLSLYYYDAIQVTHHAHATIRQPGKRQRKSDIAYIEHQIASARLFRQMLESAASSPAPTANVESGASVTFVKKPLSEPREANTLTSITKVS